MPAEKRGEEDGGGTGDGEDAAGRGDTPKKRLIVYAEECCEHNPSELFHVGSHSQLVPRHLETLREREKEAGCNGNVAVKVPPSLYPKFFPLSYYNSPSPIPHTNIHRPTGSRVAAKKGPCHRGRAGGRQGLWLRQRRRQRRRIYVAATLHGHYRLYSPPFVWVSKSEYDTLDRLYTQKEGGRREGRKKVLGVFYVLFPVSSS